MQILTFTETSDTCSCSRGLVHTAILHVSFCHCVHVALCCVLVRSAAPDFHKLNEDGELWLVNEGLKEIIRCSQCFWAWHVCCFSRETCHLQISSLHSHFINRSEVSVHFDFILIVFLVSVTHYPTGCYRLKRLVYFLQVLYSLYKVVVRLY